MSNVKIPFKTRVKKIQEGFFKGNDIKQAQCPVCTEWFNYYYDYDLRGVKHIPVKQIINVKDESTTQRSDSLTHISYTGGVFTKESKVAPVKTVHVLWR